MGGDKSPPAAMDEFMRQYLAQVLLLEPQRGIGMVAISALFQKILCHASFLPVATTQQTLSKQLGGALLLPCV